MRQLPRIALFFLILCYLLGGVAAVWLLRDHAQPIDLAAVLLATGLTIVAGACQVFVVKRTGTSHSDHLTPAPLCAAILLLPAPLLAAMILVIFLPEWYIYRRRWFIQTFNIATYMLAGAVARWTLELPANVWQVVTGRDVAGADMVIAALVFFVLQALLLGLALKLARGESLLQGGLFGARTLFIEVGLLALGIGFAVCWSVAPTIGLIAALPLLLIFEVLHVPNLRHEAATDPKTGLANMRHFNSIMARDLDRAERSGQPLSVLMCDLDYLRNINNTYGHQAGDLILVGIATIIQRNIRSSDVAARFGGEEFVVLLTDQTSAQALIVAERLRSELEQTRFDLSSTVKALRATLSIGLATFPEDAQTAEGLIHEADLAVYQAKRDGRNRVAIAGRASRDLASDWEHDHLMATSVVPAVAEEHIARWRFVSEATRDHITEERRRIPTIRRVPTPGTSRSVDRRRVRARRRIDGTLSVRIVIIAVVVLGLLGLVPSLALAGTFTQATLVPLALFAVLTIVAERSAVDIVGRGRTSAAILAVLAAAFLLGPIGILVGALALVVTSGIALRSPLNRMLFNFGTVLLATEAAAASLHLLVGMPLRTTPVGPLILAGVVAGLIYYAVNYTLLCLIRGLHEQRSPYTIWRTSYRRLWPYFGVMGELGLMLVLAYLLGGVFGIVALMAPIALIQMAIKQYMDRTRSQVEELQRVNQRLGDSYESTRQALIRALETRDV